MGLFVEFDVVDNFHYMRETEKYHIVPDYSEGNQLFVEVFLGIVDSLVPVDTGYLSSTLTADCDETSCWAETECEYAQYPEFGTWCQAAQPYFIPALEAAIWGAKPFWDAAELDALTEEAQLAQEEAMAQEAAQRGEEAAQRGEDEGGNEDEGGGEDEGGNEDEGGGGNEGGGSTSSNSSSLMDFVADLMAKIIVAFMLVIMEIMTGQDLQPGKELGSKAKVYIPEVIIM